MTSQNENAPEGSKKTLIQVFLGCYPALSDWLPHLACKVFRSLFAERFQCDESYLQIKLDQWQQVGRPHIPWPPDLKVPLTDPDVCNLIPDSYSSAVISSANVRDDLLGTAGAQDAAKPSILSDSGGELGRSLR